MRTRSNRYKANRALRRMRRWEQVARDGALTTWYGYATEKAHHWRAIACKHLGVKP